MDYTYAEYDYFRLSIVSSMIPQFLQPLVQPLLPSKSQPILQSIQPLNHSHPFPYLGGNPITDESLAPCTTVASEELPPASAAPSVFSSIVWLLWFPVADP